MLFKEERRIMSDYRFKPIDINMLIGITDNLRKKIKKLSAEEAKEILNTRDESDIRIIETSRGVYLFEDPIHKKFKIAIRVIRKDPEFKDVSYSKVDKEYEKLVIKLVEMETIPKEDIRTNIESLLSTLRGSIEQITVMVPIQRLKLMDLNEVNIGNVKFAPYESVKGDLGVCADDPKFSNRTFAVVTIDSERGSAYEKALHEVDHAINLLRVYLPLLFHESYNKKIGICKTIFFKEHMLFSTNRSGSFEFTNHKFGPLGYYNLNKERVEHLKKTCQFIELSDILSKDRSMRSDLETTIVSGIRWLGMGVHEDIACDKFLNYAIALEGLLVKKGDRGKTQKVAERSAFIIWGPSAKPKDIERMRRLYEIRSDIVHGGMEEINEEDLESMREVTTQCLFYLSERTKIWNNIDELINGETVGSVPLVL